jgi:hypothetical protein
MSGSPDATPPHDGPAYAFYRCRRCGAGYEDKSVEIEDVRAKLTQAIHSMTQGTMAQLHSCKDLVGGMGIADWVGVTWNEKRA